MKQTQKWCRSCEAYSLFAKPTFAFGWGCILTSMTGCAFFPIWFIIAFTDWLRPYRCQHCGAKFAGAPLHHREKPFKFELDVEPGPNLMGHADRLGAGSRRADRGGDVHSEGVDEPVNPPSPNIASHRHLTHRSLLVVDGLIESPIPARHS